jgi:hypothetical protein
MPQVEFEPTIPAFEPAKTVHVLERVATVIGSYKYDLMEIQFGVYIVTDLLEALLRNSSLNMFQHTRGQTYGTSVFYVVRATQQYKSCVFCVVCATQQ